MINILIQILTMRREGKVKREGGSDRGMGGKIIYKS